MVLPLGHAQTLRAQRRLRTRERWIIGVVSAAVVALAVVVVIAVVARAPRSGHGCIHVVLPAATGAQEINRCGAAARATCSSVGQPGSFTAQAARAVAAECRKAGLAVGR